jgi:septum formation protein
MAIAPPVILASSSPRREALFSTLDVEFVVESPSTYEEVMKPELSAAEIVGELSLGKALSVAEGHPDQIVIGADTVVSLHDQVFGKAKSRAEAVEVLRRLSGTAHEIVTGVSIIVPGAPTRTTVVSTGVTFRSLRERNIDGYLATNDWQDKAGSYGIQAFDHFLVERIEGDLFSAMGLPVSWVKVQLMALGVLKREKK